MDALGIEHAHLVGNSLGGSIVGTVAFTSPERVRSVTLAAGGGLGLDVARSLRLCCLPGMGLVARLPFGASSAHASVRTLFYDPARIPAEMYREAVRYGLPSFPEFVRVMAAGLDLRGVRPALRDAWLARASRYTGPVLVVWGREDTVIPAQHPAHVHRSRPQPQVRRTDTRGHV